MSTENASGPVPSTLEGWLEWVKARSTGRERAMAVTFLESVTNNPEDTHGFAQHLAEVHRTLRRSGRLIWADERVRQPKTDWETAAREIFIKLLKG